MNKNLLMTLLMLKVKMLNSPIEIKVHKYLSDVIKGTASMSDETIEMVTSHIRDALKKQFTKKEKTEPFRLRMSNIGRPYCQLWFQKNKPEKKISPPNTFVMNMMLGDIVEAVFKGVLKEANVSFTDSDAVVLNLGKDKIKGTYDLIIDDTLDDIKSASDWSYKYKFNSYDTLADGDMFGYIGQLAGYSKATNKKKCGWWVINKNNAHFKYIPATGLDIEKEVTKLKDTVNKLKENKFERCFELEKETFRGKETGNKILSRECSFCEFRYSCWEGLQEIPSVMSQAKEPKLVSYVNLEKENRDERLNT